MKKIVVLGATGNTGAYLVDYLNNNIDKSQFEIIAAGRKKTNFFDSMGIKYYSVDISNKNTLNSLPNENIYAVVFEAGILPASMEGYDPEAYLRINTLGGFNVLEYCKKVKADRIIYTQTMIVTA